MITGYFSSLYGDVGMNDRDNIIMKIKLVSTSDINASYTIEVVKGSKSVDCTCMGFQTHGYCKHIKFYKSLIKQFLDEKAGVTKRKKGL